VNDRQAEEMRMFRRDGDVLGWWEHYSDVLPDNVELLIGLETGAAWEQTYQDAFIPGLLQTSEYARAVISSAHPSSAQPTCRGCCTAGSVDARSCTRSCATCSMAQYNAMVEVLVLPYEAGEHPAQGQSFALLTFPEPEDPAIVFLDYAHSSGFLEKAHEIRQHTSVFGAVISTALNPDDSMRKIAEIAATFT
jgi:hypothetical protein